MAGAALTIRFDAADATGALNRAIVAWGRPEPILQAIGVGLARNVRRRFDAGTDPDGNPWAELDPRYAPLKKGPGILREAGMRGGLQGSITHDVAGWQLAVGTNKVYGAIHQFGGTIRPVRARFLVFRLAFGLVKARQVFIPARPYLGIGAEDEAVIQDVAEVFMARAMRGGARA